MLTRPGQNGPVSHRPIPLARRIPCEARARPPGHGSLSNDVAVSEPGEGNGRGTGGDTERRPIAGDAASEDAGVLANLPRTRPQRATARRTAARSANAAAAEERASSNGNGSAPRAEKRKAAASGAKRAAPAKPAPARAARAKPARRRAAEEVPKQGYESVEERATGPVQPPGGTELIGTAAEIVSEIAKAGISGGERVVRGLLSHLGR